MTAAGAGTAAVHTEHATIVCPDGFIAEPFDGADLVLAFAGEAPGFRPNVVLTSVASDAPLADASFAACLAATRQHAQARVLSCDAWDLDDAGVPRARRIAFTYRADATRDVLVHKWVWATGSTHVHLSASCLPSQARDVLPVFSQVAAGLELSAGAAAVTAAARAIGSAPVLVELSERVGFPLEDLSAIPSPGFRAEGSLVSLAALQMLLTASQRGRLGASRGVLSRGDRGSVVAGELRDADWVDERGRLTDVGGDVADLLGGRHIATLKVRRGERAESLSAHAGAASALVVCGAGLTEHPLPGPDLRRVAVVPAEHLPAILAGWAGIRPFWSFGAPGEAVTTDELSAHLAARADDSSGVEPWSEVLVRTPAGERYTVLSPSRGFLRVGPPVDGTHALEGEPSGALFDALLDASDRAFSDR